MDTPASLADKTIGCIGCGNMGGAIIGGLAGMPGLRLFGYNRTPERLAPLVAKGVTAVPDIPGLVAACDIVIIGVKPYLVGGVIAEALPALKPETLLISIAAGVTLEDLREAVRGRCHVVRVMPNTPALVGAGIFGIQEDPELPEAVFRTVLDLFGLLGSTIVLPEKKFNAFMALVGCGPAYVFHFMDALAEAGVTMGFTRQEALDLVTGLVLGSAKLAALPGSHPAILREQVCSPAGVTIAAINHLDRTAVRGHLIDAVLAAYAKS
uniref:pyrroline-5-carboxylate reductase n=1 Tax=uncultured Bilophila sp. TaxID=529385 RepID=UPI0025F06E20|nr:pyrroline-5-carboxylate reductase [uncultured Bilophila sp.]